jgi:hypothetical protein
MSAYASIRKTLRPIRRIASHARTRLVELPYLLRKPARGSPEWLIRSEVAYGGLKAGVARRKVSPKDSRGVEHLAFGGMTGGDRQESRRVAAFILSSLQRRLSGNGAQPFERDAKSVATYGSWPYFPRVIEQSNQLRDWRACLPNDQSELLFIIVGEERREWTVSEWARRDWVLLLRLFTASLWLSQMKAETAAFSSSFTEALAD